jgi:hypothetical protein
MRSSRLIISLALLCFMTGCAEEPYIPGPDETRPKAPPLDSEPPGDDSGPPAPTDLK